jgi:trafficking protein particle complex subunit 6
MSFESPLPPYNAGDPSATFLSSSCLDFLLIELVPLAYRLAHDVDSAKRDGVAGLPEEEIKALGAKREGGSVSTKAAGTGAKGESRMDEDEERDAVFYRLETLGYRVGQGLVER